MPRHSSLLLIKPIKEIDKTSPKENPRILIRFIELMKLGTSPNPVGYDKSDECGRLGYILFVLVIFIITIAGRWLVDLYTGSQREIV
jgi:hypothetical protein